LELGACTVVHVGTRTRARTWGNAPGGTHRTQAYAQHPACGGGRGCAPPHAPPCPMCPQGVCISVSAKDFRPYSKIASEPMGVGALQSKHRFRLRSGRNQKRFLAVFDGFRSPRRSLPRVGARGGCARPAQRPPRLSAPFVVCPSRQNNQRQPMEGPLMAIKASLRADADSKKSLRSLARNQSHRSEPMHRA
jgi:hypothetical protein